MRREADGKIVLIDFGAVKELGTQIAQGQPAPTIAIGTPGYMAFEQFNGQPQFNSDIYALGIIAIQALLGLPAEAVSSLRDPQSTPPGEIIWRDRRSVSSQLAEILDKMVLADCRQRYQSANEVLTDLATLTPNSGTTYLTTTNPIALTLPPTQPPVGLAAHASLPTQPISTQPISTQTPEATPPASRSVPRRFERQQRWLVAGLVALITIGGLSGLGISQRSRVAELFYHRGRERARYGDVKGALDNFNRAIQIQPRYADAYARRCGTRQVLKESDGAKADCQQALNLDPNNAIAHLNWGNIYTDERNYPKANEFYTRSIQLSSRLISLNPKNADAYHFRGAARFRLGDYRGAVDDATQAIEREEDYASAYVIRCQANGLLSNTEQAIEDCQKATEINPNLYAAFAGLCNQLGNAKRFEEAIDACTKALRIDPNDSRAYNNRGVVWMRMGNYPAAVDDYRQAIQRDAKDAVVRHNLGDVLSLQGDRVGAIQAYTEAIQIDDAFAAAYYARGIRQAESGNFPEAINDLQKAAELYSQQGRQDRLEDAQYQIRRIQEGDFSIPEGDAPEGDAPSPVPPNDLPSTTSVSTPNPAPNQSIPAALNQTPIAPLRQEPIPRRRPQQPTPGFVEPEPAPFVQEPVPYLQEAPPVDSAPVDITPINPAPDSEPIDPEPIDPTPINPAPDLQEEAPPPAPSEPEAESEAPFPAVSLPEPTSGVEPELSAELISPAFETLP
jgi:tetratricopeptide (TPR) repeat protein